MALEIPHIRVADDKQTQNLDRLKPWADGIDDEIDAMPGSFAADSIDPSQVDAPGCRVYRATDQTGIVTATWTAVSFSNERYDPDNMWTSGGNISIPKTGVYSLWANLKWDSNTTGDRYAYIGGSTAGTVALTHAARSASESQIVSSIAKLTAGEVVALYVLQDSGADRSLLSGAPFQEFAVQYIGTG